MQNTNITYKHYTVGFVFTPALDEVLLIRKAKPAWQAGRFNGIGGSFESGEDAFQCMQREFAEETGWSNRTVDWKKYAEGEISCHQGDCFCHYMTGITDKFMPRRVNNEICMWLPLNEIPIDIIPNLRWLIPMALITHDQPWWSEKAQFRTLI